MSNSTVLVRLKPYNPKRGYKLRSYAIPTAMIREGNWYRVTEKVARYLSTITTDLANPDSPCCFDIVGNEAEALELEERDKREAAKRADARNPIRIAATETPMETPRDRAAAALRDEGRPQPPRYERDESVVTTKDVLPPSKADIERAEQEAAAADEEESEPEAIPVSIGKPAATEQAPRSRARKPTGAKAPAGTPVPGAPKE